MAERRRPREPFTAEYLPEPLRPYFKVPIVVSFERTLAGGERKWVDMEPIDVDLAQFSSIDEIVDYVLDVLAERWVERSPWKGDVDRAVEAYKETIRPYIEDVVKGAIYEYLQRLKAVVEEVEGER